MHSISQLNDLLVPELLDLAQQLQLKNTKGKDKDALVQLILQKENKMSEEQLEPKEEKAKRKRVVKAAPVTEEATAPVEETEQKKPARVAKADAEKKPAKKAKVEKRGKTQ